MPLEKTLPYCKEMYMYMNVQGLFSFSKQVMGQIWPTGYTLGPLTKLVRYERKMLNSRQKIESFININHI